MIKRKTLKETTNALSLEETNTVLPHYDQEEREEHIKREARITLAGDGIGKSKEEKLEELREKLSMRGKT